MRVLVGTMYSNENEYEQCLDALQQQDHHDWEHFVVKNLPEKEAHDRLYERFMDQADDFDLFLKLDADMVLSGPGKLGMAAALFESEARLDHAVFRVDDWMSASPIIGIHMYSKRVRWARRQDRLFTDLPPTFPGIRRYVLRRPPSPMADHSPDPSPMQALHYGLHRGLKAFQINVEQLRPLHAISHWRLLKRVWHHFERARDPRLGLALMAVDHAVDRKMTAEQTHYTHPQIADCLDLYAAMTADQMYDKLAPYWRSAINREARWARGIARRVFGR